DEYTPVARHQPTTSVTAPPQPIPENHAAAPSSPAFPDQIIPQPFAMPVQAYQLYQPKPYQPKSKPSVRAQPKNQQLPGQAQDVVDQIATSQPQPQAQTPAQPQPLAQSQVPTQFPSQTQPQPQAPFQGQSQPP
ncbi:hypothetical protein BGX26_007724, partial [Mortierella sp. AD094]